MSFLVPLLGGVLIGLAAVSVLAFEGRIAGVSGILADLVSPSTDDRAFPIAFVLGLVAAGIATALAWPAAFGPPGVHAPLGLAGAGLLVGLGTRVGGGCTSGHGVCGIGRLSRRSIVATITFMGTGAVAAIAMHALGGRS